MKQEATGSVLVTGAARRIGRAIALDLAAHGWDVAVHYGGSADAAREVVRQVEQVGRRAVALQADLRDADRVKALIPEATAALGCVTCLVNNASIFQMDTVETVTTEAWDSHLDINLRAPVLLSQAFAAALPQRMDGNIINLLDQRVWHLTPYFLSYTASKVGLWGLTQTLAMGLAPRIRVNGIGPGPALASSRQSPEQFAEQCRRTPLGRGTTPQEICDTVRFILAAPAMTGQMIALDGGQHLAWRPQAAAAQLE